MKGNTYTWQLGFHRSSVRGGSVGPGRVDRALGSYHGHVGLVVTGQHSTYGLLEKRTNCHGPNRASRRVYEPSAEVSFRLGIWIARLGGFMNIHARTGLTTILVMLAGTFVLAQLLLAGQATVPPAEITVTSKRANDLVIAITSADERPSQLREH
jgi:hypothetical protein